MCREDHVWTHKAARRNFELDSWSSTSLFALLHLRSFFHFLESWINHDSARGNSGFDTKTVALETTVAILRKQGLSDFIPFTYLNFRAKNENSVLRLYFFDFWAHTFMSARFFERTFFLSARFYECNIFWAHTVLSALFYELTFLWAHSFISQNQKIISF